MNSTRDADFLIKAFLGEGIDELPDRSYDAVSAAIHQTRQWAVFGPWKEPQIMTATRFALIAAAIAVVAVVAIRFLPSTNIGPNPTPTPAPTLSATAAATSAPTKTLAPAGSPIADPNGQLAPGRYVAHPFDDPNRAMGFAFDVPSLSWEGNGDPGRMFGVAKFGNSDGLGFGFLLVSSLNGDPCKWSGDADDVHVGPAVSDLVTALGDASQYETSQAVGVTLGGYDGQRMVVTIPTDPFEIGTATAVGCDESIWRIWNATGFDLFAQGPQNRWTLWILDVNGTRVVVIKSDFEDSDAALIAELQSMVDSIVIEAP